MQKRLQKLKFKVSRLSNADKILELLTDEQIVELLIIMNDLKD